MIFTVAIDGPAAAGKGTISKAVAMAFGFAHLDTGLLYRAVGSQVLGLEAKADFAAAAIAAAHALRADDLSAQNLRTQKVAQAASKVAVISEVRSILLDFQRKFSVREGGAVLDGRDIGTVICPDAQVKLFVTASAEIRAERRVKELIERGENASYDEVLGAVKARDKRDAERADAPMVQAHDAVLIDTTDLTIEAAIATATKIVENRLNP